MVNMKILTPIIILLFLITLSVADAEFKEWSVNYNSDQIVLQWKTIEENNVEKFVIERSSDNKNFTDIGEVEARGAGYDYKYVDDQVGRIDSIFYYRLRVVNKDGSIQHNDALSVIPNISSISRTWGSIKALFR